LPTASSVVTKIYRTSSTLTPLPTNTITPKLTANSKPLPNGLVLVNAQDTENFVKENTPFFELVAKEQYTNGDKVEEEKDLTFTIEVEKAEQVLYWSDGFCSTSQEGVKGIAKSIDPKLFVNEQEIDLNSVYINDHPLGDSTFCRDWALAFYGWPEGEAIIKFENSLGKKRNSYTYTVIRKSQELNASNNPMDEGLPVLGSKEETVNELTSLEFLFLEDAADGADLMELHLVDHFFNLNKVFVIHTPLQQKRLVWATGWCAADKATLEENLEHIRFEMSINNTPIDIEQFYQFEIQAVRSIDFCRIYSLVAYDWPSGNTSLISKTIITSPINDGYKDYQVGEIVRTYTVKNLSQP
jgi:hypothetical protein